MSVLDTKRKSVFNRSKIMFCPWHQQPDIEMIDRPSWFTTYSADYRNSIQKQRHREAMGRDTLPLTADNFPQIVHNPVEKVPTEHPQFWKPDQQYTIPGNNIPTTDPPIEDRERITSNNKSEKRVRFVPDPPDPSALPVHVPVHTRCDWDPVNNWRPPQPEPFKPLIMYSKPVYSIEMPMKAYTGRIPRVEHQKTLQVPGLNSVWTTTQRNVHKDLQDDYGVVTHLKTGPFSRAISLTPPYNPFNRIVKTQFSYR